MRKNFPPCALDRRSNRRHLLPFAAAHCSKVASGNPQIGDINTLSPFPLVMKSHTWAYLAACAESLTAESIAAEEENFAPAGVAQGPGTAARIALGAGRKNPAHPRGGSRDAV